MIVDPLTAAMLAGVVGGASGELVKGLWTAVGQRWFGDYYAGHLPQAQAQAQENTVEFLSHLAVQLERTKEIAETTSERQRVIDEQLKDPDFSATLRTAILSAARTSSETKHELLARAVAERAATESESVAALAIGQAVEVIPKLTGAQLDFLGLTALVYAIRPPIDTSMSQDGRVERMEAYASWLHGVLAPYSEIEWPTAASMAHLIAVACCVHEPGEGKDLSKVLSHFEGKSPLDHGFTRSNPFKRRLAVDPAGQWLTHHWRLDRHLARVTLTTVGLMIGVAVHDRKAGSRTQIDLSASLFAEPAAPRPRYSSEDEAIYRAWERFQKRL